MTIKPHEVLDRAWKILESQDFGRIEEIFAAHGEFRLPGATFRGPDQMRAMCQGWWTAFPDLRHEITAWIESGDTYCCELTMVGTHLGPFPTPQGELAATGRKVRMPSCDYCVVKEGKVVSWHAYPDMPSLLAQLTS